MGAVASKLESAYRTQQVWIERDYNPKLKFRELIEFIILEAFVNLIINLHYVDITTNQELRPTLGECLEAYEQNEGKLLHRHINL